VREELDYEGWGFSPMSAKEQEHSKKSCVNFLPRGEIPTAIDTARTGMGTVVPIGAEVDALMQTLQRCRVTDSSIPLRFVVSG
jgi:hypothetical protein